MLGTGLALVNLLSILQDAWVLEELLPSICCACCVLLHVNIICVILKVSVQMMPLEVVFPFSPCWQSCLFLFKNYLQDDRGTI